MRKRKSFFPDWAKTIKPADKMAQEEAARMQEEMTELRAQARAQAQMQRQKAYPTPPTPPQLQPGTLGGATIQGYDTAREADLTVRVDVVALMLQIGVEKVKRMSKILNILPEELKLATQALAKMDKADDPDLQEVINECAKEISI